MSLPFGATLLVYRTNTNRWEETLKYVTMDGETVVVQLESGREIFRSNCVKPYASEKDTTDEKALCNEFNDNN